MRSRRLVPLLALSLASIAALELVLVSEPDRAELGARHETSSSHGLEIAASPELEALEDETGTVEARETLASVETRSTDAAEPVERDEGTVVASGRVVDERGIALANAELRLRAEIAPGTLAPSRAGETDERGSFRIESVAAAKYELVVEHDDFVPLHATLDGMRGGDETSGLVLRMDPGLAIEGVVSMPDGARVDGARLRVSDAELPRASRVARARCDADGRFVVRGLAPGRYVVDAETSAVPALRPDETMRDARFRRYRARAADVAAGTRELSLVLRHDVTLSGRVLDDRGVPVTSFGVRAVPAAGFALELGGDATQRERFDDLDGRFELDGLAPGDWRVLVRAAKPKQAWQKELLLHVEDDMENALFRLASTAGRANE